MQYSHDYLSGKVEFDQEFAWITGRTLMGITCTRGDAGWLLVIKSADARGRREVCFIGGESLSNCLEAMDGLLRANQLTFRVDKYAPLR